MSCVLVYDNRRDRTYIKCNPASCPTVYKKSGGRCIPVKVGCQLITRVNFNAELGRFVFANNEPECRCVIWETESGHCEYKTESDPEDNSRIISATCVGECTSYYSDKDCSKEIIGLQCVMVLNHTMGHQIHCVCILPE